MSSISAIDNRFGYTNEEWEKHAEEDIDNYDKLLCPPPNATPPTVTLLQQLDLPMDFAANVRSEICRRTCLPIKDSTQRRLTNGRLLRCSLKDVRAPHCHTAAPWVGIRRALLTSTESVVQGESLGFAARKRKSTTR